ncbi:MAG: glycosyltransferase family A protein, partial [Verrucomicrobia bacterium]|nr:glycosyltransferase family A protein [Verrucomicrobiota bacterium]
MNAKPLVSVIIIFLNEERFFKEAIESVLAQTYDNWELLLVDDGSTDDSSFIARHYASQRPDQIHYLEHEGHANLGMSASRNLGVRHATGQYISYVDGDDVWIANKLERQVAILDSHPEAVMVYGPVQLWYSWTGQPQD